MRVMNDSEMPCTAKRKPIDAILSELNDSVSVLEKEVHVLVERLSSVMQQESPSDREDPGPGPGGSPIFIALRGAVERIKAVSSMVGDAERRLDI